MKKVLLFMMIVLVGCSGTQTLTQDEIKAELSDLGWSIGNEFKRTQSPETVADAIKNTEIVLKADDIIMSQDLINSGIRLYLTTNPEYTLYYQMAKSVLRILGVKLPAVDVIKMSGLDLTQFSPEYVNIFLENFLKGVKGEVA